MKFFFFFLMLLSQISIDAFPGDHIALTCVQHLQNNTFKETCIFYPALERRKI